MNRTLAVTLVSALLFAGVPGALAGPDVVVKGLFKDRAVLVINGEIRLLKVGDISPEGVKLVASSSAEAEIEIAGARQVLTLSRQIGSRYREAEYAEVRIPRDPDSHYRVSGIINGRTVDMMVDTGATVITMNSIDAQRLGVNYRTGTPGMTQTAGGIMTHYAVTLDRVSIGNITVNQVPAAVLVGEFPQQILLGNSLLSRVEMKEDKGVLLLRQRFR